MKDACELCGSTTWTVRGGTSPTCNECPDSLENLMRLQPADVEAHESVRRAALVSPTRGSIAYLNDMVEVTLGECSPAWVTTDMVRKELARYWLRRELEGLSWWRRLLWWLRLRRALARKG